MVFRTSALGTVALEVLCHGDTEGAKVRGVNGQRGDKAGCAGAWWCPDGLSDICLCLCSYGLVSLRYLCKVCFEPRFVFKDVLFSGWLLKSR